MLSSDRERRVLGHLPVWAADEKKLIKAEIAGGAQKSIRSFTTAELHGRLVEHDTPNSGVVAGEDADGNVIRRPLTVEEVQTTLEALKEKGLVSLGSKSEWKMTEAGFLALTTDGEA